MRTETNWKCHQIDISKFRIRYPHKNYTQKEHYANCLPNNISTHRKSNYTILLRNFYT